MSYRINRTDGELLVDLTDGTIDISTTNLTLVGKNYKGFGESVNENFIKLLENFASTTAPTNPMVGQLWYDKADQKLKLYDGITFRSAAGTVVNSSQPSNLVEGDIWIDNLNKRLYIYDGTELTLVGPTYDAGQGKTGFESASQIDANNIQQTILKQFVGGILVGIYSNETFYIPTEYSIPGVSVDPLDLNVPKRQRLFKGFNIANLEAETGENGFWWRGTSQYAKYLVDNSGNKSRSEDFISSVSNSSTTGTIQINNSGGLIVGVGDQPYAAFRVSGSTSYIDNLVQNNDFNIRTRVGNNYINVFTVDTDQYKIDLFKNINLNTTSPLVDVWGDLKIRGELQVEGETTYVNATVLKLQDKNIELAIGSENIPTDDAGVDGGGIILRSSEGDKTLLYNNNEESWEVNQNINVSSGYGVKINGTTVLTETSLGASVTSLGVLTSLTVDDVNIDSATISRINGLGLTIDPNGGDLSLSNRKIINLKDPDNAQDAATKTYVDTSISSQDIIVSFDISGLIANVALPADTTTVNNIKSLLEAAIPVATVGNGTIVKIIATTNEIADVTIPLSITTDGSGTFQKSFTSNYLQDIVVNSPTVIGSLTVTVYKYLYQFESLGSTWNYVSVTTIA